MDENGPAPGHAAERQPYLELIGAFVDGNETVEEFERGYLELYLHDETAWTVAEFDLLDRLFADVDDYVADARLRSEVGGLDADSLRSRAALTLEQLTALD